VLCDIVHRAGDTIVLRILYSRVFDSCHNGQGQTTTLLCTPILEMGNVEIRQGSFRTVVKLADFVVHEQL
jgi:hypothetical protein